MLTNPKAQGSGCSRDVEGGGGCEELCDALNLRTLKIRASKPLTSTGHVVRWGRREGDTVNCLFLDLFLIDRFSGSMGTYSSLNK
jgi:hypothetical protein